MLDPSDSIKKDVNVDEKSDRIEHANPHLENFIFWEFFAGEAGLTKAVSDAGVTTWSPEDLGTGGWDLTDAEAISTIKRRLKDKVEKGARFVLHFAPPCSTFSRARDRGRATRLRSPEFPQGLPEHAERVRVANELAVNTMLLTKFAVEECKAVVTIENPARSYFWPFVDATCQDMPSHQDVVLSQCRFGTPWKKDTRFRSYGAFPKELDKQCSMRRSTWTCGVLRSEGHKVLEFGKASTRAAAAYPPKLCKAYAKFAVRLRCEGADPQRSLAEVRLTKTGAVKRHLLRGETVDSKRQRKEQEDKDSLAGMRNPASVLRRWPSLVDGLKPVAEELRSIVKDFEVLQGLVGCCGKEATRKPPTEEELSAPRRRLETVLGLQPGEGDLRHPASPWRYMYFKAVQNLTEDPDKEIVSWLRDGAPMGLSQAIAAGGLFPAVDEEPESTLQDLEFADRWSSNHPSFAEKSEQESPGAKLIREHVDEGFGELFLTATEAERQLGASVFPAPMGTISKQKEDGSYKHRVVQDQRRNGVNAAVKLPERQVLPRVVDHGKDLALTSQTLRSHEVAEVLVLDFANAFMSVPLSEQEKRYNCTVLERPLTRSRPPLHPDEVETGQCVVWRVLGFGGRPNPLIYSRIASFVSRTTQAIMGEPNRKDAKGKARVRLQLYVDDPVVTLAGGRDQVDEALDVILSWWLLLGVPLSWGKGARYQATERHVYIGVEYEMVEQGKAHMRLPTKFVDELIDQLRPFCLAKGHQPKRVAETVVGRVGRVAFVIPEAKPFANTLWAALSESNKAARDGRREAPPGCVACRRFAAGARWIRALLEGSDDAPFLLERTVWAAGPQEASMSSWALVTDASPWGGGAVLMSNGVPVEWAAWTWQKQDVMNLEVTIGKPKFQSFWEFFCVGLALCIWAPEFCNTHSLAVVTDNTSALQNALDLKGSGVQLGIAQELAWRRARCGWSYSPGHIPTEQNKLADTLSRLAAPEGNADIPRELADLRRRHFEPAKFWKLRG